MKYLPLAAIVLGLVLFKLLHGLSGTMDIAPEDEAGYLYKALKGDISADGLVYFYWLRFLSHFVSDTIDIYIANFGVLTVLYVVGGFALFYASSLQVSVALIGATLLAVSSVNVLSWPFIGRFAGAVAFFTLALSTAMKTRSSRLVVLTLGSVLLMYTRPEYTVAAVSFGLLTILFSAHSRFWRGGEGLQSILLVVVGLIPLALLLLWNPMKGSRSWVAFLQHYTLGLHRAGGWAEEPWTTAPLAGQQVFPGASSVGSAFLVNPLAVIQHLGRNVMAIPLETADALRPFTTSGSFVTFLMVILCALIVGRWLWLALRGRLSSDDLFVSAASVVLVLPVLLSIFLIYPRSHYIAMALPVCLSLGLLPDAKGSGGRSWWYPERLRRFEGAGMILLGIALVALVPWRVNQRIGLKLPRMVTSIHGNAYCTYKDRINSLRSLELKRQGVHFLSPLGFLQVFLPEDWEEKVAYQKHERFQNYAIQERINLIWVNEDLLKNINFREDPEFQSFIRSPGASWARMDLAACQGQYLLVRRDILR